MAGRVPEDSELKDLAGISLVIREMAREIEPRNSAAQHAGSPGAEDVRVYRALAQGLMREAKARVDSSEALADQMASETYEDWSPSLGHHRHHPLALPAAFLYGSQFRFLSAPLYALIAVIGMVRCLEGHGWSMPTTALFALIAGLAWLGAAFNRWLNPWAGIGSVLLLIQSLAPDAVPSDIGLAMKRTLWFSPLCLYLNYQVLKKTVPVRLEPLLTPSQRDAFLRLCEAWDCLAKTRLWWVPGEVDAEDDAEAVPVSLEASAAMRVDGSLRPRELRAPGQVWVFLPGALLVFKPGMTGILAPWSDVMIEARPCEVEAGLVDFQGPAWMLRLSAGPGCATAFLVRDGAGVHEFLHRMEGLMKGLCRVVRTHPRPSVQTSSHVPEPIAIPSVEVGWTVAWAFQVLGLAPSAGWREIWIAQAHLRRELNPDGFKNLEGSERMKRERRWAEVERAMGILQQNLPEVIPR